MIYILECYSITNSVLQIDTQNDENKSYFIESLPEWIK